MDGSRASAGRCWRFLHQADRVDPKLSLDRSRREPLYVQHQQVGLRTGYEIAGHLFPELNIVQIVAGEEGGAAVHVLNGKTKSAGSFNILRLVVGGKFVPRVGRDRDGLANAGIIYALGVEGHQQGAMTGLALGGVEQETYL